MPRSRHRQRSYAEGHFEMAGFLGLFQFKAGVLNWRAYEVILLEPGRVGVKSQVVFGVRSSLGE